jgi:hypothetical protein
MGNDRTGSDAVARWQNSIPLPVCQEKGPKVFLKQAGEKRQFTELSMDGFNRKASELRILAIDNFAWLKDGVIKKKERQIQMRREAEKYRKKWISISLQWPMQEQCERLPRDNREEQVPQEQ